MPHALTVSLVLYRDDPDVLAATLTSLAGAVVRCTDRGLLSSVVLHLVNNGPDRAQLNSEVAAALAAASVAVRMHQGRGNVGYGRGHNTAILECESDLHLVLNPDVILDPDALSAATQYLDDHSDIGLVTPLVQGADDKIQYLCRDYPTIFTLFLRSFAPGVLRRLFRRRLEQYELRDRTGDTACRDVPLATGCFMFARTPVLHQLAGFSPQFFMYFEDYDLSIRLRRIAGIAYVPQVRVVHFGGNASQKGLRHTRMYLRSAVTFFSTHGWRWL